MYISVHVPLGVAIGVTTGNVWLAGVLAFISHFVLDRIPHWQWLKNDKLTIKSALTVAADIGIAIGLFVWLLGSIPEELKIAAFIGALFAALPDLDIAIFALLPGVKRFTWLKRLRAWHDSIQCEPGKLWAILPQIAVVLVSIIIIAAFSRVS